VHGDEAESAGWCKAAVSLCSIQHAGSCSAGEFRPPLPRKTARSDGYLGQLRVPHRGGEVTGQCMAIERPFETVGGFDSENLRSNSMISISAFALRRRLPISGCLIVLCHHRIRQPRHWLAPGGDLSEERRYFLERWGHVVRDDPYSIRAIVVLVQPSLA